MIWLRCEGGEAGDGEGGDAPGHEPSASSTVPGELGQTGNGRCRPGQPAEQREDTPPSAAAEREATGEEDGDNCGGPGSAANGGACDGQYPRSHEHREAAADDAGQREAGPSGSFVPLAGDNHVHHTSGGDKSYLHACRHENCPAVGPFRTVRERWAGAAEEDSACIRSMKARVSRTQ